MMHSPVSRQHGVLRHPVEHSLRHSARHLLAGLWLTLAGCQIDGEHKTVDREVLDDIDTQLSAAASSGGPAVEGQPPQSVLEALVPGLTIDAGDLPDTAERFDFVVQEPMDAREFFRLLTEGTEYSIAIHPSVQGSVSALDLKNVTIEEALAQISGLYGFTIERSGNIFQVLPGGVQTRIFKVDYLNVNRNGNSNMSVVAGGIVANNSSGGFGGGFGGGFNNGFNNGGFGNGFGNNGLGNNGQGNNGQDSGSGGLGSSAGGAMISTQTQADYWQDLTQIISAIINSPYVEAASQDIGALEAVPVTVSTSEKAVIVSPQTGMIVVRAFPSELDQVAEFLALSQASLQRQVVLEAKILEVELKEGFQAGIDLSALAEINSDNTIGAEFGFLGENLQGVSRPLSISYGATDFEGVLTLLETQGNVQVISNPRIATLNNQKAVFKVGDEQYFLTNANTTSFGAGEEQTTTQNTSLQPFFSGIALDVTPQISDTGDIILHIHPLLNQVTEDLKVISGEEFPLANSTTRESDSIARARNGEVIVISGLMQTRARGNEGGVPGARDIPILGAGLEQRQTETVKTELVILLRAIVDEGDAMQNLIQEHQNGFNGLRDQIDPYFR
jgi:MSHA biogenesis protein MshL